MFILHIFLFTDWLKIRLWLYSVTLSKFLCYLALLAGVRGSVLHQLRKACGRLLLEDHELLNFVKASGAYVPNLYNLLKWLEQLYTDCAQ